MFKLLKELFSENPMPREAYKSDSTLNLKIIQDIRNNNDTFSETFFIAWAENVFIRYAFLVSKREEKVASFEKLHLDSNVSRDWINDLKLFELFKKVYVKNIDFLEYTHTNDKDYVKIRLCVIGKDVLESGNNTSIKERKVYYYDMSLSKKNDKNVNDYNIVSNCPNCGAPTDVGTFGICDHCHESISIYDNIWKIRGIVFNS